MPASINRLAGFWKVIVIVFLVASNMGTVFAAPPVQISKPSNIQSPQPQSSEGPRVLRVTPEGGFLHARSLTIRITFSQAMDHRKTEASFSIQPELAHKFKWDDSTALQIEFSELFAPGTQYVLTFSGDVAADTSGRSLPEDYRWYYWLDPFDIQSEASQADEVRLTFSQSIDRKKSGLPFDIDPSLEGTWKWVDDKTALFSSTNPIPHAQRFEVHFAGPLYDQFGEIPYDGPVPDFTAPAPIRAVEPDGTENVAPDFAPITVTFSEPVDQASAQNAFRITPPVYGYFSWSKSSGSSFEDVLSFVPDTLLERGQTYTVSISPSLKNRAGQPLMLSPYSWSFDTGRYYYSTPVTFGEYGYNIQVVDVNGPRKVQLSGADPIQFETYRYDLIDFVKLYSEDFGFSYGGMPTISLPTLDEDRLAATWYSTGHYSRINETTIPSDVPAGLYLFNLKQSGRSYSQLFLVLTRNTLVAKLSGNQLFVWLTDFDGAAIEDAEIRLYSDRGEKIREGKTDSGGIYRVTVPDGYNPMLVSARVVDKEKNTDVTITGLGSGWYTSGGYTRSERDPARYKVYTYTDRPIYKPGQTIYYKSIVRLDQDVRYSILPSNAQVTINIRDPKNNLLESTQTQLNEFNTLNGSFVVSEGAALGEYTVEVIVNGERSSQVFKVEDYRKPDFQVTLSPSDTVQNNQYVAGESFDLDIDVRYFFDEPVVNANLVYKYYELDSYYDWWNPDPDEVQYRWIPRSNLAKESTGHTASDGKAKLTIRTHKDHGYYYLSDWHSSLRTQTFAVEVTADDGSNQPVSGYFIYKVTNAAEKLSLDTLGYFKRPNSPFTVRASVQDLFDRPVSGRELILELHEWNKKTFEFDPAGSQFALTTDETGTASQELNLEAGYYMLSVNGIDPFGNIITYERWLRVFSSENDWYERISTGIEISADQDGYKPYQTAHFMIESTFSGPALLTFERGSVVHTKQVMLTAPLTLVEAQIIPEDAPNVFVTINAWEPTQRSDDEELDPGWYFLNIPDSYLRMDRVELQVEATTKALDVSIRTDKSVYVPGDPVTVDIEVKDDNGEPVKAEVSLALVDEAIYSLSNELAPHIFKAFYGPRPLSVKTYDSMSPYREIYAGGRGGGGGEGSAAGPRADFPDTAAWYPALRTDSNGQVSVTLTLPDNITSWRLSSKAITLNHKVGEKHANIEVKKDLLLRPILPRVLTTGDQADLTVMVHNYANVSRTVEVSLKGQDLELKDEATQSINIPAGGTLPVGWRVIPHGTTETQLTFSALANDRSSDSVQLPLPVQPLAIADVHSLSGEYNESTILALLLPADVLPDNSLVTLRLSRTPASTLLDGLEFLTGYPYGCVEQIMSRAMPNAVLGRASAQLGIGGDEFRQRIDPLIAASIQKLYGLQHNDGGWGWWFDDSSDAYQSAWVLHGLAIIQSAGYSIEPGVLEKGAEYLSQRLDEMDEKTRAYALYSMALAGYGNLEATRSLANSALRELDPFSQAAVALALHNLGDVPRAEAVIDILEASVMRKGVVAYWPQSDMDGVYHRKTMASTIRTTAFVLSAIVEIKGKDHPFAKPAADYLISKRNGYGWGTTNETAFTILALTDYLSAQQPTDASAEFQVVLNGSELSTGKLEPGRMFFSLQIPISELGIGNNQVRLESSGESPIFYDLITRYSLSRSKVEKSGGIDVTRQYLDPKTKEPLEKIAAGQLIQVQLTVRMPEAGSYMSIEDHLPGGLEALNEGLNSTSHNSENYDELDRYFWQDYGYNNKEIHGERVTFFITEMKTGVTELTYLARATTAGTFTALPVDASAMYDPLLWGRSADSIFVVEP